MRKLCYLLPVLMWLLLVGELVAQTTQYQVGVCDWMVLKRQKLGQFALASELACDGVELDMGGLGNRELWDNQLRDEAEAKHFLHVADSLGVSIGAIAMSGFYAQDLTKRDNYMALLNDCFDTMDRMGGVMVAFLPLGGCGNDWTTNREKRREVVSRLHIIGEAAKARGKRVGIDTPLDAKDNLKLLHEIKSDGIGIFYKFQTAIERGVDIAADLKRLGAKNICAIHASNTDGVWLRNDSVINMPQIKQTLDQMGWQGWLFVERSRDTSMVRNVKMNYGSNVHYLKTIFNEYPAPAVALDSAGRPADYVETIVKRAQKATDELGITWTPVGQNVLNIICNRYFRLNDIYAEQLSVDSLVLSDISSTISGNDAAKKLKSLNSQLSTLNIDSKLYRSHFGFEADLSKYLNPAQIETVKDVMTFHVVQVTYDAQLDMIPTLKEEEKQQILIWLKEARELAIDAESSKKKHEVFGKYKGRINNYLSRRGYDLTKEREAWYERLKEK